MHGRKTRLVEYFLGMALAAGILFFLSAVVAEPFKKIVLLLNDRSVKTTAHDWWLIVKVSVPTGLIWASLWLWFKGCEKKFLEVYFTKK
jgi:hypothetical protein